MYRADLLALLASGSAALRRPSAQRLERLHGSLLQMNGAIVQELGLHKVLTSIVDDTAALCEAIHADYLDPPAEELLRGARRLRVVPSEPSARQIA